MSAKHLPLSGLVIPLAVAATACGPKHAATAAPPPPAAEVYVGRAHLVGSSSIDEVVGTVRARHTASIAPTILGRVVELRIDLGQKVRSGEVLARISAGEIGAKVAEARAVSARATADFERAAKLFRDEAIPRAQYDAAKTQLEVARASFDEASAMADHAVLRAPFTGVVTAKLANAGDTAVPGQPLLVIEDPTALRFEATVPEAAARALSAGQRVAVRVDGIGDEVEGTVAEISPVSDPSSRTVLAKIDLPPDQRLHPGLFGRLSVVSGRSQALAVPPSAVVRHGQLEEVFVIDGGSAHLRLVRTGHALGDSIEIVSGLREGDTVAASDVGQLVDEQPVKVLQ